MFSVLKSMGSPLSIHILYMHLLAKLSNLQERYTFHQNALSGESRYTDSSAKSRMEMINETQIKSADNGNRIHI